MFNVADLLFSKSGIFLKSGSVSSHPGTFTKNLCSSGKGVSVTIFSALLKNYKNAGPVPP